MTAGKIMLRVLEHALAAGLVELTVRAVRRATRCWDAQAEEKNEDEGNDDTDGEEKQ